MLGAAVHIFVVLASPRFAEHDAIAHVQPTLTSETAQIVSPPGGRRRPGFPCPIPPSPIAACAFDLSEGPARIAANTGQSFLSFSLHTKTSGVFFAVTDRAAIRGELELVVMTQRQLDEARAEEDENEPSRDVQDRRAGRAGLCHHPGRGARFRACARRLSGGQSGVVHGRRGGREE